MREKEQEKEREREKKINASLEEQKYFCGRGGGRDLEEIFRKKTRKSEEKSR